jgi:cytochrome P450
MLNMLRWIRTPFELLERSQADFGDAFTIRLPMMPNGITAISDPAAIKEIFGLGPDDAHAGEANVVLKPFLGSHSLLLLDGAQHLRHRKLLLPPFHGERMHAYGRTMIDLTHDTVDALPVGRTFPIHTATQSLTIQIIVRTVFGIEEGPRFSKLADLLARVLDASAWPGLLFPIMQHDLGPLSPWGRWKRIHDRASKLLRAEITAARDATKTGRTDVLAMLLATELTDDEIHDELVTLLVAGHETTATSIAWALRWLLPNRKLLGELRDDIAGADGDPAKIGKLELLDDVVKETLRLQPVVPMVGRVLQKPMKVAGWDLPRGAVVAPAIYLVHRRPSLYPRPTLFDPRRFRTFKPAAWEFLPFGGGLRKCVGAAFAIYEMKMVLATLLPRVEMHLADTNVRVTRRSITLTPSNGLPVIVTSKTRRSPAHAA